MAIKINNISTKNPAGYTYVDLKLDLQVQEKDGGKGPSASNIVSGKDIVVDKDTSAIRNALINLLTTKKGERTLLPNFGVNLYKFIGEPIVQNTAEAIAIEIQDGIKTWEPRVNLLKLYVIPQPDDYLYNVVIILQPILLTDEQLILGGSLAKEKGFTFVSKTEDELYREMQAIQ